MARRNEASDREGRNRWRQFAAEAKPCLSISSLDERETPSSYVLCVYRTQLGTVHEPCRMQEEERRGRFETW